ncbi:SpoVT-AbrB domain-containing protein [Novosphingobium lubricantis]|jgi:antitoxin PrlF
MAVAIEEVSTITAKGQTTIPKAVRQALGVDYGGKIAFRVDKRGVTLARVDTDEDPALDRFLDFVAADIKQRPQAIKALSPDLAARIAALTEGLDVDLDAAIDGDVSL